jgi:hypothetical protein
MLKQELKKTRDPGIKTSGELSSHSLTCPFTTAVCTVICTTTTLRIVHDPIPVAIPPSVASYPHTIIIMDPTVLITTYTSMMTVLMHIQDLLTTTALEDKGYVGHEDKGDGES